MNYSLGEAEIYVLTRNDRRLAVASPNRVLYRRVDDPNFSPQILSPLQISDIRRHCGDSRDEFETLRLGGRDRKYRQSYALRSLRHIGRARAFGVAKALGRMDIFRLCDFRHWNRNRPTYNGCGPIRVTRRHGREPFGHRVTSCNISLFLDTTSTLRRRHLCAA